MLKHVIDVGFNEIHGFTHPLGIWIGGTTVAASPAIGKISFDSFLQIESSVLFQQLYCLKKKHNFDESTLLLSVILFINR